MKQTFIIYGRLGSLNEYSLECRKSPYCGNNFKHKQQEMVIKYIKESNLERVVDYPLKVVFSFYEKNHKRDIDNISSWAHKSVLDALVVGGILENDGWKQIISIQDNFSVDKDNPRIEITLETIERE